jgi:hypothetical protein
MNRKRLPAAEQRRRAEVREAVFHRDGGCLLRGVDGAGRCFGGLTPHHRRKASQGGTYDEDTLATLCAHHNDELEANADLARLGVELGLVIRRG